MKIALLIIFGILLVCNASMLIFSIVDYVRSSRKLRELTSEERQLMLKVLELHKQHYKTVGRVEGIEPCISSRRPTGKDVSDTNVGKWVPLPEPYEEVNE